MLHNEKVTNIMIPPPIFQISHHHKVTNITMSPTSLSPFKISLSERFWSFVPFWTWTFFGPNTEIEFTASIFDPMFDRFDFNSFSIWLQVLIFIRINNLTKWQYLDLELHLACFIFLMFNNDEICWWLGQYVLLLGF